MIDRWDKEKEFDEAIRASYLSDELYNKRLKDQYMGQVMSALISLDSDCSPQELLADAKGYVRMMMDEVEDA